MSKVAACIKVQCKKLPIKGGRINPVVMDKGRTPNQAGGFGLPEFLASV
jgi:hypothetical protein